MGRKAFIQSKSFSSFARLKFLWDKAKAALDCRKIAVTEQTYYRWRKEYGGMGTEQLKRMKELEKVNGCGEPSLI